MNSKNKNCYLTIFTDKTMLKNILKINQRLQYLNCQYSYYIVYPKENILLKNLLKDVPIKTIPISIKSFLINKNFQNTLEEEFLKYELLKLTNFKTICLLSQYCIVNKNLDFLFNSFNYKKYNFLYFYIKYNFLEKDSKILNTSFILISPNLNKYINYQLFIEYLFSKNLINKLEDLKQLIFFKQSIEQPTSIILNFFPIYVLNKLNKYIGIEILEILLNYSNEKFNSFIDQYFNYIDTEINNIFIILDDKIWNKRLEGE